MEQYWANRPKAATAQAIHQATDQDCQLSEFDRHRQSLVMQEAQDEGWAAELCRYLKDMPANVSKDTDIVEWWQVIHFYFTMVKERLT